MTPIPTLSWLRDLSDADLIALLQRRPDLVVPAPSTLDALAHRLDTPGSVWRALETLDLFTVQVLQSLVVLGADHHSVSPDEIRSFLGKKATKNLLTDRLSRLESFGLVRGGKALRVPRSVAAALGPYPGGLGPVTGLAPDAVAERLAECPERGRTLLDRLAESVPVGSVSPNATIAPVVQDLIARGLLLRRDSGTVELPREVGLVLRGDKPLGELHVTPPAVAPDRRSPELIDQTAAGQAISTLRTWRQLLAILGTEPATALKSGGLAVRDLRRLAKVIEVGESIVTLHLELMVAAGLLATTDPRGTRKVNLWTPTSVADDWLALSDGIAWTTVALTWIDLRREPARVGERDQADKVINALAPELVWVRGPADRRWVLHVLAKLPPGSGMSAGQVQQMLAWQSPLRAPERRGQVVDYVLSEATTLGVIAFGSLTRAGRALLAGDDEAISAELETALPPTTDRILVQADLTIIGAGRLLPSLAASLELAALVESSGSATVYRVTPDSVRRALDAGMSAAELHALFADHSTTPIPQALSYLIDDVARRHGAMRAGSAQAYLRCDDPVLIETAIARAAAVGIQLRKIAPTVAISQSSLEELLTELRKAGLAPSAEDQYGLIIELTADQLRSRATRPAPARWREPAVPGVDQLSVLVARMRSADHGTIDTGQSPADAVAELRTAANAGGAVWIEYVNAEGAVTRRLIEPLAISAGAVSAFDRLSGQMRTFAIHRISGIRQAED